MKPSAYLINTARAAVIDQKDFVEALASRQIAGAAVDVYWQEPVPANHPLLKMRNVVCTPHMAGLTTDVDAWSGTMMGEEIISYLKGEPRKYLETEKIGGQRKCQTIRKTVLDAIQEAVEKKLINGTSGNIAFRDPEHPNILAITPSGISYTGMKLEDIAIVEMQEDGTNKWIERKL